MFQGVLAREEEPLWTRDWLVRLSDSGRGLFHRMDAMAGIQCCGYRLIRAEIVRAPNSNEFNANDAKVVWVQAKAI